ncbi:MAG TPA: DUF885 domain-containing protein [Burkholderiaceae bacterium]|jgi:uncharacterized protein (DUF885 family)
MKRTALVLSLSAALCAPLALTTSAHAATAQATAQAAAPTTTQADAAFTALAGRALAHWMRVAPINATFLGEHKYDKEIDDYSAAGRAKALAGSQKLLAELDHVDITKLSRENQIDALLLRNQLRYDVFTWQAEQDWAWDPQVYSQLAGNALYNLMAREYAPLPQRLKAAAARMEKLPQLFAQARANLDPARVPKIHAETVAKQNGGVLEIVDTFITPHLDELQGADRARLVAAIATLKKAVSEQQEWLDKTLVPNAKGDFRIGQKLYDQKLQFALNSALSRAEIKARAEAELKRVRIEMYEVARTLVKDLPANPTPEQQQAGIEAGLELAYAERPKRDELVADATATLAQARQFLIDKDLISVPNDPVRIITMPEFQQGVAVAYCDSPGPLDKGLATFYAVSPIPKDWTDAQVNSFLREYNSRMIHLLSIHEGIPGHYLEGAYSARFPSTLRATLRSGLFAEGWAVYSERMMRESGYLNNDPLFHLVQLKFYLRTIANALLDQGVHVDGWTREQAMELMTKQTFQQEREAAGKWVRAQLTSAQLPTYFVGVQEQLDMREAVKKAWGPKFTLKAYHDAVLSYGAPPVRFVREMILDEPIR